MLLNLNSYKIFVRIENLSELLNIAYINLAFHIHCTCMQEDIWFSVCDGF